ncbi:hypothetical protein MAPG_12065, partial [Magnaporthiopsis poae ATCC 64411]|uniref:Uncharacterized protein n=1 Tax=Magnaporthiopsis poae (strain ATCC 64411 / 73-15) TaxID=644358 RepID=A0A0C4EGS0_MAGP6
ATARRPQREHAGCDFLARPRRHPATIWHRPANILELLTRAPRASKKDRRIRFSSAVARANKRDEGKRTTHNHKSSAIAGRVEGHRYVPEQLGGDNSATKRSSCRTRVRQVSARHTHRCLRDRPRRRRSRSPLAHRRDRPRPDSLLYQHHTARPLPLDTRPLLPLRRIHTLPPPRLRAIPLRPPPPRRQPTMAPRPHFTHNRPPRPR